MEAAGTVWATPAWQRLRIGACLPAARRGSLAPAWCEAQQPSPEPHGVHEAQEGHRCDEHLPQHLPKGIHRPQQPVLV